MKLEASLNYFKKRRKKVQLMEEECAIYALEKQIPKKPKVNHTAFFCPCCKSYMITRLDGYFIVGTKQKYCHECGQALDWEDVK